MGDYTSFKICFVNKTREEEVVDENSFKRYKEIVSSLPRDTEESYLFENYICNYQGFWYTDTRCQSVLAIQEHFKARSRDIIVANFPKSGTTWINALVFATATRSRYLMMINHPMLSENPHGLVPSLETGLYNNRIPNLEILPSPRLFGTHISYTSLPQSMIDSGSRIVYICRNLKDVFVSLWHFINKIRAQLSKSPMNVTVAFERFCKGVFLLGPFWDHVLGYWRASLERPEHVLFIKYEELKADPGLHLKRVAEFLGYPFTYEEEKEGLVDEILRLYSFEKLSGLEVNRTGKIPGRPVGHDVFFREGKVGDWKNYLTSEMIKQLDKITEEKFHGYVLQL